MIEILELLNADAELTDIIGKNHIYPNKTTFKGNCIVYEIEPISDDKIKQQDRIKMNIIADTFEMALQIEERIKADILTFGDVPLTNNILQVEHNGGGQLFDEARQKYHRILYFDILRR